MEHDQKTDNETEIIERGVYHIIRHERYSTSTLDNDIALIKMDEEVDVHDELMPACMPPLSRYHVIFVIIIIIIECGENCLNLYFEKIYSVDN